MDKDSLLDFSNFVSKVANECILSVETTQISRVLQLLSEKCAQPIVNSYLWNTYNMHKMTPSEAATDILNEFVVGKQSTVVDH